LNKSPRGFIVCSLNFTYFSSTSLIDSSHKRHITKAITWRFIGTLDTFLLAWIITGDSVIGLQISVIEVLTKTLLYYLHERLWFNLSLGERFKSRWRHIFKSVSWRFIGTLDTILISWLISGNALTGLKIGALELVTKMLLYYLHERVWYRINFGLEFRREKR